MTAALTGIRFLFAVMFLATGTYKLLRRTEFELVLVQLFGTRPFARPHLTSRTSGAVIAGYELVLGLLLGLGFFGPLADGLLVATMVIFLVVVARAVRQHVSCGCFPGRRSSEVSSLVRCGILLALALLLAVSGAPGEPGPRQVFPGAAWAVLIAAAAYLLVRGVRRGLDHRYPPEHATRRVPGPLAAQVLAAWGITAGALPEWVDVVPLCRSLGLPVSSLFRGMEQLMAPGVNGPGRPVRRRAG